MRKVLGAQRRQLIRQFLGEAMLMSSLALILAIGLAELLLPELAHCRKKFFTGVRRG